MRKVIQVTSHYDSVNEADTIIVLCDDETLWTGFWTKMCNFEWDKIPPIPQDDEEKRSVSD